MIDFIYEIYTNKDGTGVPPKRTGKITAKSFQEAANKIAGKKVDHIHDLDFGERVFYKIGMRNIIVLFYQRNDREAPKR